METLRAIAVSLCIATAVTGILSILIPAKGMERTVKLAVGLFFLCSIVMPFAGAGIDFDFHIMELTDPLNHAELEGQVEDNLISLSQRNIEQVLIQTLALEGIEPEKVKTSINITGDNSITITKVSIVLSQKDTGQKERVSEVVRAQTGILPEFEEEG